MFRSREAEILAKLQEEAQLKEQEESDRQQSIAPEAYSNMMEDLNSVLPQPEMDLSKEIAPISQQKEPSRDIASIKTDSINKEAKSPHLKTKEEKKVDSVSERDPRAEYLKLIDEYKTKLNEKPKGPELMDALPEALAGLYNIGVRAKGGNIPEIKMPNILANKRKAQQEERNRHLGGLEKLTEMHRKYQAMGSAKDKKDTFKVGDDLVKFNPQTKKYESVLGEGIKKEKKKPKTKLQEEREKNIADRYDNLQEQIPQRSANIQEAKELIKLLKKDKLDTGPGSKIAGDIGSFFDTEESTYKQRLDSLSEKAARAALKANGEVRPTDADVEGMKRAMFNLGNTEDANIKKLEDFITQQESGIDEYQKMKTQLRSGKGLEDFILDPKKESTSAIENKIKKLMDNNKGLSRERAIKALKAKGLL